MTASSEGLKAVLRCSLPDVTFDIGRIVEKGPHGSVTSYANLDGEVFGPKKLREIYEGAKWGDKSLRQAWGARVNMPETTRSRILDALRELLGDYVDPESDTVGHAFPMGGDHGGASKYEGDGLYTHADVSSMKRLADVLARGAIVAGCDRVAELLTAWVSGGPMSYRTCTVVPMTLARPLSPAPGIDMVPLPRSTDQLPPSFHLETGSGVPDSWGRRWCQSTPKPRPPCSDLPAKVHKAFCGRPWYPRRHWRRFGTLYRYIRRHWSTEGSAGTTTASSVHYPTRRGACEGLCVT